MRVDKTNAAGEYEHDGLMYYFDSDECMRIFYEHPEEYTGKSERKELNDAAK
jgi:YHS domain-containing protein